MKTKLRNCPFCGSKKVFVDYVTMHGSEIYNVLCLSCGAEGPPAKSSPWATRRWNKRHEPEMNYGLRNEN